MLNSNCDVENKQMADSKISAVPEKRMPPLPFFGRSQSLLNIPLSLDISSTKMMASLVDSLNFAFVCNHLLNFSEIYLRFFKINTRNLTTTMWQSNCIHCTVFGLLLLLLRRFNSRWEQSFDTSLDGRVQYITWTRSVYIKKGKTTGNLRIRMHT